METSIAITIQRTIAIFADVEDGRTVTEVRDSNNSEKVLNELQVSTVD